MADLLVAFGASLALSWILLAAVKLVRRADASRLISKLGVLDSTEPSPSSRRVLLGGVSEKVRATALGRRLDAYAARTHPSVPFSDVVAIVLASVVGGALAGTLLFGGGPLAFLSAVAGPLVADRVMVRLGGRRMSRIEQQLPDALALQAAALRAGHSLVRSLRVIARESKPPLSEEVSMMVGEVDLGRSLDESIQRLARRIQSRDVLLWVTAMQVHRVVGGDLSKVLERLASQIRERGHVRSEVRALTAQARLSGQVVALAPLGFFLLLSITARDQMRVLYTSNFGLMLLMSGLLMEAAGLVWIRWLLRSKL